MPKLDTTLHLDMLMEGRRQRRLASQLDNKALVGNDDVYGLEWGDPEVVPPLRYVRDHFLTPYIGPDTTVVEIGPGGGRWTRYMLQARHIDAVDFHQELLDELKRRCDASNIAYIKNNGDDFPGINDGSIDFVFSFGVFVHLDIEIIDRYLRNIRPLLKHRSNVVIQYADKTKPLGRLDGSFSENDPDKMRSLVLGHGYSVYEEDVKTMWHNSIIRFGLPVQAN